MHPNLERRFVELEVSRAMLHVRLAGFTTRFVYLFDNLANDMGITKADLARRLGWEPFHDGGNRVSRGEADPSPEDCYRLLGIYLAFMDTVRKQMNTDSDESRPERIEERCDVCGWPLKERTEDGCTKGNCSMRPTPKTQGAVQ